MGSGVPHGGVLQVFRLRYFSDQIFVSFLYKNFTLCLKWLKGASFIETFSEVEIRKVV